MSESAKPRPEFFVFGMSALAVGLGLSFGVCTQDDAFISFRYAENLAQGNGLVFNVDERVEGFTNLSWTVLFAVIMALGGEPVMASVILGWIGVATLVALTAWLAHRHVGVVGAMVASVFMAMDAQMVLEGVEGLETVAYASLIAVGVSMAFQPQGMLRSTFWFSLAAVTRPEAPLIWGSTHLGLWLRERWSIAAVRKTFLTAWPLVLTLLGLTLWRLGYYGDWLPNTFYAKTGGFAVERGLVYMMDHMLARPILWLAALASLRMPAMRPLAIIVAVVVVYVLGVGGDFKPTGRFLIPVLPILAVMASAALVSLWQHNHWRRLWVPIVLAAFVWCRWNQYSDAQMWAAERHANLKSRQLVGDWLAENTPSEAVIAVHSAGVVPYYAGRKTIDMWGLTNRQVARTEVAGMGTGMAGHERHAPEYVFSLEPDIYLPEAKLFTLRPWHLKPESGVSSDFADHYRPVNVAISGRWLNMWVRKGGSFGRLQIAEGAIEQ